MAQSADFETLISNALEQPICGWDFAYLRNRVIDQPLSWQYRSLVESRLPQAAAVLDMGTGGDNEHGLNRCLGAPINEEYQHWCLDYARQEAEELGFIVIDAKEEFPEVAFTDVGAIVYYLRMVPWQIPDFSVEKYADALRRMHERIQASGPFVTHGHRFYLELKKP
ncbi:hypothetical protein [Alicyclobacillus acidiphilus]|uniref:hypothetical protein n=1 Tax=Alicyclobacillus acidiphilus TaxID=182455 RepID=UPI000833DC07|nr:hypothetical protein [Alicyclobacillus acidiphilus]